MLVRAGPRQGRHRGDVDPARPQGRRSPATAIGPRSTRAYSDGRRAPDAQDGQALLSRPGEPFKINHVDRRRLRRLPAGGRLPRLRLRRHRPPLLQRQRRAPARLRDDRHQPRLPEARAARTRWTTCATATPTTTSCAPPASRTSCASSSARAGVRELLSTLRPPELARIFGRYTDTDKRAALDQGRSSRCSSSGSSAPASRSARSASASAGETAST